MQCCLEDVNTSKHKTKNLDAVSKNTTPGRLGINAKKFEKPEFIFNSDAFAALSVVVLYSNLVLSKTKKYSASQDELFTLQNIADFRVIVYKVSSFDFRIQNLRRLDQTGTFLFRSHASACKRQKESGTNVFWIRHEYGKNHLQCKRNLKVHFGISIKYIYFCKSTAQRFKCQPFDRAKKSQLRRHLLLKNLLEQSFRRYSCT